MVSQKYADIIGLAGRQAYINIFLWALVALVRTKLQEPLIYENAEHDLLSLPLGRLPLVVIAT
jgi:hypothetical protein